MLALPYFHLQYEQVLVRRSMQLQQSTADIKDIQADIGALVAVLELVRSRCTF